MSKFMLRVNYTADGAVQTVVLMTPEELDAAARKSPLYAAPGR